MAAMDDAHPNGQHHGLGARLPGALIPTKLPVPINPALIEHAKNRAEHVENRIADKITAFAGSMHFVALHVIWFTCWIAFGVEAYPFGLLTMIVSLEAIFLSTFVMISQNRADAKRQAIADLEWKTVQLEDRQNEELLDLTRQILGLTKEVRDLTQEVRGYAADARAAAHPGPPAP
jgi:uncharacterized membrane protein